MKSPPEPNCFHLLEGGDKGDSYEREGVVAAGKVPISTLSSSFHLVTAFLQLHLPSCSGNGDGALMKLSIGANPASIFNS